MLLELTLVYKALITDVAFELLVSMVVHMQSQQVRCWHNFGTPGTFVGYGGMMQPMMGCCISHHVKCYISHTASRNPAFQVGFGAPFFKYVLSHTEYVNARFHLFNHAFWQNFSQLVMGVYLLTICVHHYVDYVVSAVQFDHISKQVSEV